MKTIQFTPHEAVTAHRIDDFDGNYYTAWDTRSDVNKNGVADWLRANNKRFNDYRDTRKGVLGRQLFPTQAVHYSEIVVAGIAENNANLRTLNYITCPTFAEKNMGNKNRMIFIKEDAIAIRNRIDAFIDSGENPLLMYKGQTNAQHQILQTGKTYGFSISFNPRPNDTFEIEMPEHCEFVKALFRDHVSVRGDNGFLWVKIYDYEINQVGNKLLVTIIPTTMWDVAIEQRQIGMFMKPELGRGALGVMEFKFNQPGEYAFPNISGAHFTVEGEVTRDLAINTVTEAELETLKEISGVGDATVQGIINARNKKPFADEKDLQRAKYVGAVRAKQIVEFPVIF